MSSTQADRHRAEGGDLARASCRRRDQAAGPSIDQGDSKMRQRPLVFFPAFFLCALTSPRAQSQSLGQALYDAGYTKTVWVNSFDRRLAYLAHGVFHPATPIHNGDYNARYGMSPSGSGTVSFGPDGYFMAT